MAKQIIVTGLDQDIEQIIGFISLVNRNNGVKKVDVQELTPEQVIGRVAGLINTKHLGDAILYVGGGKPIPFKDGDCTHTMSLIYNQPQCHMCGIELPMTRKENNNEKNNKAN